MSAFKLVRQLPDTFEPVKQRLLDSISNIFFDPKIKYEDLVQEAKKTAKANGQLNIFSEKKIPKQTAKTTQKNSITINESREAILDYIKNNDVGEETIRTNQVTWSIVRNSTICA